MTSTFAVGELAKGTGKMGRVGVNWLEVLIALLCKVIFMQVQTVAPGGILDLWVLADGSGLCQMFQMLQEQN